MQQSYDIIIIGGGVVGCNIAREMAKYQAKVLLLEKESDVAMATSGKNSGVIHSGFDTPLNSLKARLNVAGNKVFGELCAELDVPFKRVGTLIVARKKDELPDLEKMKQHGQKNGVPEIEIIGQQELKKTEPNINGLAALHLPTGGITSPYQLTIALAENALQNGVKIRLNTKVVGISKQNEGFWVKTSKGLFQANYVINSAGLFCDKIARMVGIKDYRIYPCRGQYYILDKRVSCLINKMVYPVPPKGIGGKGIHLTPTIEGNILIGPSAEYVRNREDVRCTRAVMHQLYEEAKEFLPQLTTKDFIHNYAGLRAKLVGPKIGGFTDFVIEESPQVPNFINLIGIESPGLTSAPAIAEFVVEIIQKKENLKKNSLFNPKRVGIKRFDSLSLTEKARLIKENPNYGQVVCRCENVTKQEILDALANSLGVKTLMGLRYRSRAMMGRCQGGYCLPGIVSIMGEMGLGPGEITLKGKGSEMFTGRVK